MLIRHKNYLYNTLLLLSRNIFFYKRLSLPDTFETRVYLMLVHFSILMIVSKNKGVKFDQKSYDYFFFNIENDLREQGFGDVAVNKKMKDLNNILYDILLKINLEKKRKDAFKINHNLISKYFVTLKDEKQAKYKDFEKYFINFFYFCFELSLENMLKSLVKFKI